MLWISLFSEVGIWWNGDYEHYLSRCVYLGWIKSSKHQPHHTNPTNHHGPFNYARSNDITKIQILTFGEKSTKSKNRMELTFYNITDSLYGGIYVGP